MRRAGAMALRFVLPTIKEQATRNRALEPLVRVLNDTDAYVQLHARLVLQDYRTEEAERALRGARNPSER
jgi:hypothetical protein